MYATLGFIGLLRMTLKFLWHYQSHVDIENNDKSHNYDEVV